MHCVGTISVSCRRKPGFQVGLLPGHSWVSSLAGGSLRGEIQSSLHKHAAHAQKAGVCWLLMPPRSGEESTQCCVGVCTLTLWGSRSSPEDCQQCRLEAVAAVHSVEENIPNTPLCICLWASFCLQSRFSLLSDCLFLCALLGLLSSLSILDIVLFSRFLHLSLSPSHLQTVSIMLFS